MRTVLKLLGILLLALVTVGIALFIRNHGRYSVSSDSMAPTLKAGDVVTSDSHAYQSRKPARGEVVVWRRPEEGAKYVAITRIVGVPGDAIAFPNRKLELNGKLVEEKFERRLDGNSINEFIQSLDGRSFRIWYIDQFPSLFDKIVHLGQDEYFIAGDNRDNAKDSRYIGPVHFSDIIAKVSRLVGSTTDKNREGQEFP